MNSRIFGFVFLIVMGAICAFLSGWVYLLEGETRFALFALLGVLIMAAGIIRIVRERRGG
jgi:uncharacterized membrane protein HdeD (DUF308 family)